MAVRQNLDANEGTGALFEQGYVLRFLKKDMPTVDQQKGLNTLGTWEKQTNREYKLFSKEPKAEIEKKIEEKLHMKSGVDFRLDIDEGAVFFTL